MVFIVRNKKRFLVFFLIVLGMLIASVIQLAAREVKADQSNAMQVVKVVESQPQAKIDFFTEYRLERDKLRSERSELLRESMQSASTEEARHDARENVMRMMQAKQRESEIEGLIKAKGFADALVFCRERSVSAVIKANALTQDEVVQVADVISRVTSASPEDITISAKP